MDDAVVAGGRGKEETPGREQQQARKGAECRQSMSHRWLIWRLGRHLPKQGSERWVRVATLALQLCGALAEGILQVRTCRNGDLKWVRWGSTAEIGVRWGRRWRVG